MKKSFFLTFLALIFGVINMSGQTPWAEKGASWYYSYSNFSVEGYVHILCIGDTTMNGINCSVLSKTRITKDAFANEMDSTFLGFEYAYEYDNRVYYLRDNIYYVLYDFAGVINEKWEIGGSQVAPCLPTDSVHILGNGDTSLNGFVLRTVDLKPSNDNQWGFSHEKIIERIGSLGYMFPEPLCITDSDEGGQLRCYQDGTFGSIKFGQKECDFVTGIAESSGVIRPQVFPNPTSNSIQLSGVIQDWVIVNLQGQELGRGNSNETELDVSEFPSGVYFLKSGEVVLKFVKN
jgi:hypothetical protein